MSRTRSSSSDYTSSSFSSPYAKYHAPSCDSHWDAIGQVKSHGSTPTLSFSDLNFLHRLGCGDIGSVYLVELKGRSGCTFAAKVMDKRELVSRNKESRAKIEREILEMLDHPFLPTLYATIEAETWSCMLTEFCSGSDLHVLRQRQPDQRFHEAAVRFYSSEVVAALEYLHMLGILYRDLKPENVLIRSDGHIMLTDFDLSLKDETSSSTAQIVCLQEQQPITNHSNKHSNKKSPCATSPCMISSCIVPAVSCFTPKRKHKKSNRRRGPLGIVAEPVEMRSMSFVGTHEYLAPEIVSGEGHGNAVDWWTLGVFMYELLYGVTPFKGYDHELTLTNVVARGLEFPKEPCVSAAVKDLIAQLLAKEPSRRLGSTLGATAIKRHPFFEGTNWALLRCASPPFIPPPLKYEDCMLADDAVQNSVEYF